MLYLFPRFLKEGPDGSGEIERVFGLPVNVARGVRDVPRFCSCTSEASKR